MLTTNGSNKLSSLLRLCFSAGIVMLSGAASADCSLDHTICTEPGPVHNLPSICDQYPGNVECLGGQSGTGQGDDRQVYYMPLDWLLNGTDGQQWIDWTGGQVPRAPGNTVQASCSSSYAVRKASAYYDTLAWWPTFQIPGLSQAEQNWPRLLDDTTLVVRYSSGQRELWFVHFRGTTISSTSTQPSFDVGHNSSYGEGFMRLSSPQDWSSDWVISYDANHATIPTTTYCK